MMVLDHIQQAGEGLFTNLSHNWSVENTHIHDNIIIIPNKNPNVDNTIVRIDNWGGPWPMKTTFENSNFISRVI